MDMKTFSKTFCIALISCIICSNFLICAEQPAKNDKIYITVDGGSATKKSPISQAIAERFNLVYLETGAMFRTITYALLQEGILPIMSNEARVDEFLNKSKFEIFLEGRVVKFTINGIRLSHEELRSEKVNANVAEYTSLFKSISDFCIKYAQSVVDLKDFQKFDGIIAEGRTCGMYLFPNADLKFWFSATVDAKLDFRKNVEKEIDNPVRRDSIDFSRKFYPMIQPQGAIHIWTSSRSIDDNITIVSSFVEQKLDYKKHFK